jgi:hypothetical protein
LLKDFDEKIYLKKHNKELMKEEKHLKELNSATQTSPTSPKDGGFSVIDDRAFLQPNRL